MMSEESHLPRHRPVPGGQVQASDQGNMMHVSERLSAIEQKLSSLPAIEAKMPAIEAKIDASVAKIDALVEMMTKRGASAPTPSDPVWTKNDQPTKNGVNAGTSLAASLHPRGLLQTKSSISRLSTINAPVTSDSSDEEDEEDGDEDDQYALEPAGGHTGGRDEGAVAHVLVESDVGMVNPKNKFRMIWDLGVVMPLLVYLSIVMPFRLTFANEASQFSSVYWFEFLIDMLFIFDIIFNFRTGYIVDEGTYVEGPGGEEIQKVEYDRSRVAINYIKSWFILDVVSGIPFALLELLTSNDSGDSPLKSAKVFKLLRFLKLGRLLKLDKILSNLDQDTLDVIEDFFQDGTTRSAMMMLKLIFCLAYVAHLMACGLVLVGKVGDSAGVDSWLAHEIRGPFISEDTTGINGGGAVYSIYIASFYFSLTTMTSVGYGDIITRNNLERLYVISLEFMGAIIFATVIAAITSVVSSMDMNARKTAEELDAVASFVAIRQFPTMLARKIRRHFRHFYSRKSAIDESKIFSELSTTLREKVSEYLVTEILGKRSFFKSVSSALWPKLIPLLRPMNFMRKEPVCSSGSAATEMYVVISGWFVGKLQVGDQERVRNIINGDSVNTLLVLGIWDKCIESVEAVNAGETYAISEQDFKTLYSSDSNHASSQSLKKLQRREVRNYKMEPIEGSEWGKPLYFTHFSSVEFSLVQLCGSFLAIGEMNIKNTLSEVYVGTVVELVDTTTGAPFNDFWRYATAPKRLDLVDGQGIGELSYDNSLDTVSWHDISVPFHRAALCVSLHMYDKKGASALVGWGVMALEEVKNAAAATIFGAPKGGDSANKPLPPTTVSSVHLGKEGELDTWLSLTNVQSDHHFSSGSKPPDALKKYTRGCSIDRGNEGMIEDKLHLRVSARAPENMKAPLPTEEENKASLKQNAPAYEEEVAIGLSGSFELTASNS